jgi:rubrerythrin
MELVMMLFIIKSEGKYIKVEMIKLKQIDIFSLTKNINEEPDKSIPKGVKLKKGQLWCPYCSNPVMFVKDNKLNIKKCPICGISDRDFWVKKVNNIWR